MKKLILVCLLALTSLSFAAGWTLNPETGYKGKYDGTSATHLAPSFIKLKYSKDGFDYSLKVSDDFSALTLSNVKVLQSFDYKTQEILPGLKVLFGGSARLDLDLSDDFYLGAEYVINPMFKLSTKTKYEAKAVVQPKYLGQELVLNINLRHGSVKALVELGNKFDVANKYEIKTIASLSGEYKHPVFVYKPSIKLETSHKETVATPSVKSHTYDLTVVPADFTFKPYKGLTINAVDTIKYSINTKVSNEISVKGTYSTLVGPVKVEPSLKLSNLTEYTIGSSVTSKFEADGQLKANYQVLPVLELYGKVGVKSSVTIPSKALNVEGSVALGLNYNF